MFRSSRWLLGSLLLVAPFPSDAVPILQLDIAGGRYDAASQSIVTSAESFTLHAYAAPQRGARLAKILGTTFYLAVALQPRTGPAGVDLGFVVIDGRSVQVTADMLYGVPPVERGGAASFDPGDLARHDVYETFFLEVPFRFDVRHRSRLYDTRQHAGQGPLAGLGLLDRGFRIDVSHLAPGYDLHFDLYDEQVRRGDVDAGHFAPFDHDASTARVPSPTSVPEPGTVSLVAIGLLAGGAGRRRRPAPEACAKASNAFLQPVPPGASSMSRALRSLFAFLLLLLVVSPALAGRLRQREREGPPYRLRSSPGVEQAVPEPGALVAFALGAAAVGLRARRLRRG